MATASLSLVDFARAKRLKDCNVCALPEEVRTQLREAADRKIDRLTQLEWLASVGHGDITDDDLTRHKNGLHEHRARVG